MAKEGRNNGGCDRRVTRRSCQYTTSSDAQTEQFTQLSAYKQRLQFFLQQRDVSTGDLYRQFDRGSKGYVTPDDIRRTVWEMGFTIPTRYACDR